MYSFVHLIVNYQLGLVLGYDPDRHQNRRSDPDPYRHQNVTDPQHWYPPKWKVKLKFRIRIKCHGFGTLLTMVGTGTHLSSKKACPVLFSLIFPCCSDAREVVLNTAVDCLGWRNRYDAATSALHLHHVANRFFFYIFCLHRPFRIFERCLDSNPESCRRKQGARYQVNHPSP